MAAAAAVVAVLGGVAVGVALQRDGSVEDVPPGSAQRQQVAAVTSQPTERWSWSATGGSAYVVADGDLVVAATGEGEAVTRLTDGGTEMWSNADAVGVADVDEEGDRVLVSTAWEDTGFAALDAGTGAELWRVDEWSWHAALDDSRVLATRWQEDGTTELAVLDEDGEVLWEGAADAVQAHGDAVHTVSGSTVSRLDGATGDIAWEADTGMATSAEAAVGLAVNDGLVAVSAEGEAVGLDIESGAELWREDGLYDYSPVSPVGSHLVYVTHSGDVENGVDGEAVFFSRGGVVDRRTLDAEDYGFYATSFVQDGDAYLARIEDRIIYDEELEPVTSYDGELTAASSGYYQAFNGELSYHLLDGTEKWSRQVADPEEYAQVVPLDREVLVVSAGTVTAYE